MIANESHPAGNEVASQTSEQLQFTPPERRTQQIEAELREALNTIRREREWQLTDKLRDYATSRGVNPVTEARE